MDATDFIHSLSKPMNSSGDGHDNHKRVQIAITVISRRFQVCHNFLSDNSMTLWGPHIGSYPLTDEEILIIQNLKVYPWNQRYK